MWKFLLLLAVSVQPGHYALAEDNSRKAVCNITDNDVATEACSQASSFGGCKVFSSLVIDYEPVGSLYVKYGNLVVGAAQQIIPSKVLSQPTLNLTLVSSLARGANAQYSVVLADSQETSGALGLNWFQSNMTLSSDGTLSSSRAAPLSYSPPAPPKNTGTHDYIFLVLSQSIISSVGVAGQSRILQNLLTASLNVDSLEGLIDLDSSKVVAATYFKSVYNGAIN